MARPRRVLVLERFKAPQGLTHRNNFFEQAGASPAPESTTTSDAWQAGEHEVKLLLDRRLASGLSDALPGALAGHTSAHDM